MRGGSLRSYGYGSGERYPRGYKHPKLCGVRVEDPSMQKIRYLDKLVDEISKGRPVAKVMRA